MRIWIRRSYKATAIHISPHRPTYRHTAPLLLTSSDTRLADDVCKSLYLRCARLCSAHAPLACSLLFRAVVSDDPPRAAYDSDSSSGGSAAMATALAAGKRGLLEARAVATDGGDSFCGEHRRWRRTGGSKGRSGPRGQ